jgi:hypothetical protein
MIVGFSYFGWMLGSSAERMAAERADRAMVVGFVPICVDRFRQQPDAAVRLGQFKQVSTWQRREFVERGGWATVPGSERPNGMVASACADALADLTL